jgi:hypothetical protein
MLCRSEYRAEGVQREYEVFLMLGVEGDWKRRRIVDDVELLRSMAVYEKMTQSGRRTCAERESRVQEVIGRRIPMRNHKGSACLYSKDWVQRQAQAPSSFSFFRVCVLSRLPLQELSWRKAESAMTKTLPDHTKYHASVLRHKR